MLAPSRAATVLALFVLSASIALAALPHAPAPQQLVLERALPVEGPERFQPSGLALLDGELWTVSDKHGLKAFRLDLAKSEARVVGEPLPVPGDASQGIEDYDAEGIAFRNGDVYIASEEVSRIFCVYEDTGEIEPITPNLAVAAATSGLFALRNAGIEGFAFLDDRTLIVAAERQPRGLIEVDLQAGDEPAVRMQNMDATVYPKRPHVHPDFADLTVWQGRLFALARNQYLVVELVRDADGIWAEGRAWSYREAENDPDLRYRDRTFGLAEGLAIDDEHIYVALDNNDDAREGDDSDRRPQLFIFANSIDR